MILPTMNCRSRRLVFVLLFLPALALSITALFIADTIGLILLPVSAVLFVVRGDSGIDWYGQHVLLAAGFENPWFKWMDSLVNGSFLGLATPQTRPSREAANKQAPATVKS